MRFFASFPQLGILAGIFLSVPAFAQTTTIATGNKEIPAVPSQIVERVDETRLVKLQGNTHPYARAEFDKGAVDSQLPMERMNLVLKRSAEQESALQEFMTEQQDPRSENYHHWLQPQEFGLRYGLSERDIQSVTSWLENHGFRIEHVSNARTFIEFSGTATQVKEAFHTEIHRYTIKGEQHISNNQDPSIPEALSPVVVGIESLNNFFPTTAHIDKGNFHRDAQTGKWKPVEDENIPQPSYIVSAGSGNTPYEEVTPWDFAAIYNVLPLWNAGVDGTGVTIAIAGGSEITLSDVATFRSAFGLPAKVPTVVLNGADPGVSSDDEKSENSLDVEWSGAVAKNADVKLVLSKATATAGGAGLSVHYIVDNDVASIMSFSYQSCELHEGSAGNSAENSIWQQAAAEGITAFVASGDYDSAQCDGGQTGPYGAENGLLVSGLSSTPYDTAVGGTDLNWYNNPNTTYWAAKNAANGSSALGIMPEVPWNTTCASVAVDYYIGAGGQGLDPEQTCQTLLNNQVIEYLVNVVGGSGGKSSCTTPTGTTNASCAGGYAKPSWQTGPGVPADGKRDVPDLSLFASANGLNSGYLFCNTTNGPCDFSNASDAEAQVIGGTSVASPAMAGIMALVVQKQGGKAQGLANPVFYQLAAKDNLSSCNSNTVKNGNGCIFYDITSDTNAPPCVPNSPDCTVHHSGDNVGILNGYSSTSGYDLATGLGSVNAANLVNQWPSAATTSSATLAPATVTFPATNVGSTNATKQVVTLKNTGTAPLTISDSGGITITGNDYTSFSGASNCSFPLAAGATCTISLTFTPAAAGTLTAKLSVVDSAGTQSATISGTGTAASKTTVSVSPSSLTFPSTAEGKTAPAQVVTVKNTGTTAVTLGATSFTGTNIKSFIKSATTCGSSLATGASCTISIEFEPAVTGSLSASLNIADNASGSPQLVALSGTATATSAAAVTLTPSSIQFPATINGTESEAQVVTLKNTGSNSVTIGAVSVSGSNPTSFLEINSCGASLSAGASCSLYVAFKPLSAASLSAFISVTDAAGGSPQKVTLAGVGTAPPSLTLSSKSLAFPTTKTGVTSAAQTLTLTNSGASTLTLASIAVTGTNPLSFQMLNTCGATLSPSTSCTVYIAFVPAKAGALSATLVFSDDAATASQSVTLTGTGD